MATNTLKSRNTHIKKKTFQCHIHDEIDEYDIEDIRKNVCVPDSQYPLTEFKGNHYCLFHLPIREKDIVKFEEFFIERIEAVEHSLIEVEKLPEIEKKNAKDKIKHNFSYVWFPSIVNFDGRKFLVKIDFNWATFSSEAYFNWATFSSKAYFNWATFSSKAYFNSAKFLSEADFRTAKISSDADFRSAEFSSEANFRSAEFSSKVNFNWAKFSSKADFISTKFFSETEFNWVTFSSEADFISATFSSKADFISTIFSSEASFNSAIFSSEANFRSAKFSSKAEFNSAIFSSEVNFISAVFSSEVEFNRATFSSEIKFISATFFSKAYFISTTFSSEANFRLATFSSEVYFNSATFTKAAFFWSTLFKDEVIFGSAVFGKDSDVFFGETVFAGNVYFEYSTIEGYFRFSNLKQGKENKFDFQEIAFEKANRISFHTVRLNPSWFVNVDSRSFVFTNIEWQNLTPNYKNDNIKSELKFLEARKIMEQKKRLLEIACRQLADNAEENNRYEEASNFRYMAMETRRLEYRGWRRIVNLTWFYKWTSGYGESWRRAAVILILLLAFFGLFYDSPFASFESAVKNPAATMNQKTESSTEMAQVYKMANSEGFVHSLFVAALQRPEPKPFDTQTKIFIILETIFAPLQSALLALAIRRKFMR